MAGFVSFLAFVVSLLRFYSQSGLVSRSVGEEESTSMVHLIGVFQVNNRLVEPMSLDFNFRQEAYLLRLDLL